MRHSKHAELERAATEQGWTVEHRRGRHTKMTPPDRSKPIVYCASTPSDRRSWRHLLSQMRASGLRWPR